MSNSLSVHDEVLDLDRFRVAEAIAIPRLNQKRQQQIVGGFLKGPIPMVWLEAATKLGGKALNVGLAAWFESGRRRGAKKIKLTTAILKRFAVDRKAKYRALKVLEKAELIVVIENSPGRNPWIEIRE